MKKLFRLSLLLPLALVVVLAGCPAQRKISEINRDPSAYFNKEVTIVGTVQHAFGALGQGVYEVNDGTGSIWVLSQNYGVPADNTRVGVTGTVIPTFTFAGRSYATGLRETRHRSHP